MSPRLLTFIVMALIAASPLAQTRPDGLRTEETKTVENSKAIEQAVVKEETLHPEERIVTIMAVPMVPDANSTSSTEPTTTSTEPVEANVTLAAPPPLQNSSNAKVSVAYPSEETTAKLDLAAASSVRPLEIHDFSAAPEVKLGEGHHSFDESLILRNKESQTEAAIRNVQEDPKAPSVLVAEEKVVVSTVSSREAEGQGENQASTVGKVDSEPVTPLDELANSEGDQDPLILRPTVKSTVEPILVPVKIPLVCPSCGRMSLHHPGEEPCACQHCGCDMSDQHGGVTSHLDAGMSGMPEFYRMGNAGHQQTAASPFQVYQRGNILQMQGAFQNQNPSGQEAMKVRMVPLKADFDFRTKNLLKLRTDVDNLRSYKEAIGVPKGQLKLVANYKYMDDRQGTGKLPVPPAIPMAPVMYTMQLPNLPSQHQSMVRPTERPLESSAGDEQQSKWKWSFSFPSWFWGGTTTEEPPVEVVQEPLPKPMKVQQKPTQIQPQLQVPQAAQTQVKPPRAPQQFQIPIQTKPPAASVKQPQADKFPEKKPQMQQQPVRQPDPVQPQQQQQSPTRPEQRPQVQQQQVHQQTVPEQRPQFQQQLQVPQQQVLKVPEQQQQQRPEQFQQVPQLQQRPEQLQQVPKQQQQPEQLQQVPQQQQRPEQLQQVPQQQQRPQQPQQPPKQPEPLPQAQQHQSQPFPAQQPLKTPELPQQVPQQQRPVVQQQSQAFQPQQQQPMKTPEFSMQQQPKAVASTSPNLALPAGGSATPVQMVPQQRLPQRMYYRAREAGDVVVGPPYRAYDPEVIAALKLLNDPYEQLQN